MMISVLCIVLVVLCLLVGGDRTAKTLVTLSFERGRFSCCDLGDFFRTSADDSFHCGDTDRNMYYYILSK